MRVFMKSSLFIFSFFISLILIWPLTSAFGQPAGDSDLDFIIDEFDECPNEPETYNDYQDEDGCPDTKPNEGGCLIATATFGSELAPQVQLLREIRDNSLLQTKSGTFFINSFNNFYYSFSPYIADYERENPVFKEMVKIAITPLISSLSILNYIDMDSESKVLGYGISLILLNFVIYFGVPMGIIFGVRRR